MPSEKRPEKKNDTPPKPTHSARKVKSSFIDLEPTIGGEFRESHDERLHQLVRLGLGDLSRLALYVRALSSPRASVNDAVLRPLVGDSLERLLRLILEDPQLYTRLRNVLLSRGRNHQMEDVQTAAMQLRLEAARDPEASLEPYKRVVKKKHPRKIDPISDGQ